MYSTSEQYKAAIDAPARRVLPYAEISIIDPDIVYGTGEASPGMTRYSNPGQMINRVTEPGRKLITLEHNYWLLDGSFEVAPMTAEESEVGIVCDALSDDDCNFSEDVWIQLPIENLGVLQAASIYFTGRPGDGHGVDFGLTIYSDETAVYTQEVTGNTDTAVYFDGFTVWNATALRVRFTRWSLPSRRPRLLELLPGIYEIWNKDIIDQVDVLQQTDFSNLTVTFGTAALTVINEKKRFNPRSKNSIFHSIEERQGIPIRYGVTLPDGTVESVPLGVFYQQEGGWRTGAVAQTFTFNLVDIVGLVASRVPELPGVLPSDFEGWIALILSPLGDSFSGRYTIDPAIASAPLTADREDVESLNCGTLLRYACMARGAVYMADPETGYLKITRLENRPGALIGLNSMFAYPAESANDELADITFKNANGITYTVVGTLSASGKSQTVQNPFLLVFGDADVAARNILSYYGGSRFVVHGRGDMSCELGDVDVLETGLGDTVSARRYKQQLRFGNGVMLETPSFHLLPAGQALYTHRVEFASEDSWTAPEGVTEIRVVLVGPGEDGAPGGDGSWYASGEPGNGGSGGRVYTEIIPINPGQTFAIGVTGEGTSFGVYSSEDGTLYPGGYGDVYSGKAYGLPGDAGKKQSKKVIAGKEAEPGTGGGGQGGSGGYQGVRAWHNGGWLVKSRPVDGGSGGSGGTGAVIIYYD